MNFVIKNFDDDVFAKKLVSELDDLGAFAHKITHGESDYVLSDVINEITVVFNRVDKPYMPDTTDRLRKLLGELYDKYSSKNDNRSQDVALVFKRLSNKMGDCGSEKDAEGIYCPIFNPNYFGESYEINEDIDRVRRALVSVNSGFDISGIYNHRTKTITFYTQNIDDDYESYLSVFAHEFFHAIHYSLIEKCGRRECMCKYYHDVVSESLTSYFEINYMESRGYTAKATKEKIRITSHSPIFFPYSGCKYLFNDSCCDFCTVLKESLYDFYQALRLLIMDKYEAAIILKIKKSAYKVMGLNSSQKDEIMGNESKCRNFDKYIFQGQSYGKNRLVLAVVKEYVRLNNPTLYQLAKAFPDNLQGIYGVFQLYDDVKNQFYKWSNPYLRFFEDEPITVEGQSIIVCNQWGIDNISNFIAQAMRLGFSIQLV